MKNGHARRLPAAFRAALACGGVSEWGDVGAGNETGGGQAESLVGEKMEDWREGTVCLEQFADRTRCLAAKNSERSE
jgi:hypothetical protein